MKPRLREDVRFVEFPDGVYIHSDHGAATLAGSQAYAWLSRLAPALTGEYTLDEMTAGLAPDKRAMVEQLVTTLAEQRYVVDAQADEPHGLGIADRETYADEIAFIRYAADSAERRFERLRETPVAVVGRGPLVDALVAAVLHCGFRDIVVQTDGGQVAQVAGRRDAGQSVRVERPADTVRVPSGAGLVLQVSDDRNDLIAMCRACADSDVQLGQVWVRPTEAWLTQVGPPEQTAAESAWRRLTDRPESDETVDVSDETVKVGSDTADGWWTGPVPTVVASQLAMACFARLTGLDALPTGSPGPSPTLTRVDLRTLDTSAHRIRRHPLAASASASPAGLSSGAGRPVDLASVAPVPAATLWERVGVAVDSRTGLIRLLDEGDLGQTPLWLCRATVADPLGTLPSWAPAPEVFGWGGDRVTARLRTLLGALAAYAGLAVPPDSTPWGWDLSTRTVRPAPRWPRPATPYRPPVGVAAGLSWDDAVAAGLRAQCAALAARRHATTPEVGPDVDPADVADARVGRLLRQLSLADEKVRVRELTGILGVATYAFSVEGRPTVVTCDPDPAEALRDGLERVLLAWQAGTAGDPVRPDSAPAWPPAPPAGSGPASVDEPGSGGDVVTRLVTALRSAGRVPVAVPLHHDPEAVRVLPFLVRVVLCDE
ncbi:hypothetical protein I0C86_32875 [Plantactinospora sp. S1510]|uniref:YcaO domain-containing protein n=1 Tax=Plantactinospora alkalitolerans TaxID=2789879 RepID=A0ABS0H5F7_9ACTN|nr:hypothetical protein [Plantactinospora alkalitolerans]MBF9133693.1 hypothetical protein [Plantactinospora alkalitolerans]